MEATRRRITLHEQMTAGSSRSRDSLGSLMLNDVVFKKAEAEEAELNRSRTLQDIIREEKPHNNAAKDRKSWKAFKEKLRLKRAIGSAWSFSTTTTTTDHSNDDRNLTNNLPETRFDSDALTQRNDADGSDPTARFESPAAAAGGGDSSYGENNHVSTTTTTNHSNDDRNSTNNLPETRLDSDALTQRNDAEGSDPTARFGSPVAASGGDSSDEAVVGVSLMHLLEEAEQEMDLYRVIDEVEEDCYDDVAEYKKREEQEKGGVENEKGGVVEYKCCVCMVRHKGAAFIPCGHTFCRMCSREIWVRRGNCPLCNNLILEILDIF